MIFLSDIKKGSHMEEINSFKENWSNDEISTTIEKLDGKLRALGFERVGAGRPGERAYARRDDVKNVYVGTFVNQFSLKDEIPLWSDNYINSYKYIIIGEVYRHNGTSQNSSLDIGVTYTPKYSEPRYFKEKDGREWVSTGCMLKSERVRKFKPSASEKILEKAVNEAIEKLDSIPLEDYSKYAKNRADYHEDTSEAHWKWVKSQKK